MPLPPLPSPAPMSRCPTADQLVELLDPGATGCAGAAATEATQALQQHTVDCPMCSVTWAKVQAGHAALAELPLAAPQVVVLERLARAVLPEVARDLAPRRPKTGKKVAIAAVVVLLILLALIFWRLG